MKKQVYLDKADKDKLSAAFSVTDVMVWKALTFTSNSDLAKRIRYTALKEFGAQLIGDDAITGCKTTFDSNGDMTQTFGARVQIKVYRQTERTAVLIDGEVKKTEDNLTVSEFVKLQAEVLKIANDLQLQK